MKWTPVKSIWLTCSKALPSKFFLDRSVTGGTPRTRQVPLTGSSGADTTNGRFWTFLLAVTAWNIAKLELWQ